MTVSTRIIESQKTKLCAEDCKKLKGVFWLLVVAQFVIAGLMVVLLDSAFQTWWTTSMATSAIALGVWAIVSMGRKTVNVSPALRPTARMIIRGPYRFVRHPMYTALALFCGAIMLSDLSLLAIELWVALLIVLAIKTAYEEGMLKRRFPEYEQYAKRTKRYLPFIL
jgi:protein-S-isoprenylcysteine O-methyltransferase Ste14